MKQLLSLLLLAGAFGMTSCQKDASSEELFTPSSSSANRNNESNPVPIKGSYVTVHTLLQGPAVQRVNGTGAASHLGESSFVANANINFNMAPPFAVSGSAIFTAANGDQFFTQISGQIFPATGTAVITHTINGGTGRFDDATGSFLVNSTPTAVPLTNNITIDGSIDY